MDLDVVLLTKCTFVTLFISRVRCILSAIGVKVFIAGSVSNYGFTNGNYGYEATFGYISLRIAVDTPGNIYVADRSNMYVRKITAAGFVSSFAYIPYLHGVIVDSVGGVYATSDYYYNAVVYKISASGNFTRLVYHCLYSVASCISLALFYFFMWNVRCIRDDKCIRGTNRCGGYR